MTEQLGFTRTNAPISGWNGERLWLAFLDVWERHVSVLEAPAIRDVALGGADTSTRAQVVWCVRILEADEPNGPFSVEALQALPPLGTGRLRTRTRRDCASSDAGGYRGVENRLYRVEIHCGGQAGTGGGATVADVVDNVELCRHPLLRRWDHPGRKEYGGALRIVEQDGTPDGRVRGWVELEEGVEVSFDAGGEYRAGDFWMIPARVASRDVVWPQKIDGNGRPEVDIMGAPVAA